MQAITTIGLDIAKSVFQVHGVDAAGQVVIRRQLKRLAVLAFFQKLPPCLVGIRGSTIKNPGIRVWLGRGARRAIMRAETNQTVGQDRAVAFSPIDRKAA